MGCGSSTTSADGSVGPLSLDEVREFQRKFHLDPERLEALYARFRKHDKDNSGFIDIEEFGRALEIDHAAEYVAKLYQLFDQDDSGEIDFREFVIGCSQFTSADSDAKLRFAFWLYDFNADGTISKEEMAKLLEGFNLASAKQIPAKVDMIFQKVDRNRDGVISFDEFRSFASAFPSMVFPAYSLWYRTNGMAGTK